MRARLALLVALGLAALAPLVATGPAAAAEIFSDDFESANLSAWTLTSPAAVGSPPRSRRSSTAARLRHG